MKTRVGDTVLSVNVSRNALRAAAAASLALLLGCSRQVNEQTATSRAALGTDGLVAAYNFNEGSGTTLGDLSPAANSGAISGPTWSTGIYGGALSFDGSNDWVTVGDANSLDLTNGMTLEAWVNPAARNGWAAAVLKEGSNQLAYTLYANDDQSAPGAFITTTSGTGAATASGIIPLNQWSHVAATYDATTLKFYLNGALVDSQSLSGALVTSNAPLRLGGNSIWGDWFQGKVDDVRVYSRALPAAEISADMDTPIANVPADSTPPTVALTGPSNGATLSGQVTISATAADNATLTGVHFFVDGLSLDNQDTSAPYAIEWNTRSAGNGSHTVSARARDAAGNATTSSVTVTVQNGTSGLVAAYAFDEGSGTIANDASGDFNTGTISGATWTASGKHGGALSFDGIDDWVTVNGSGSLELTTGMTMEAWVRPSNLVGWACAVLKESTDDLAYGLYVNDNLDQPGVWIGSEFGTASVAGAAQVPLNTWTHLAATYDATTLKLYVNGVLAASEASDDPLRTSSDPLRIGGNSLWGEFFEGFIDDVRVYSRALSAGEIGVDMATPVASNDCSGVTLDDGNPCTLDACDSSTGVTHAPVNSGTSCSDGNACNGAETCNGTGTCTNGTPPTVDDANPCTTDVCDPVHGVTHTPVASGTSCVDGNACNGAETCNASGTCVAGTPPVVDDGNPCTADACNPSTGVTHTPLAAGTSCSDANACNGTETCNASATCVAGTPPTLDDGNPCTTDACNASTGVTHTPVAVGTTCSDGNACNGAETCSSSGTCVAGTVPALDDGNPCTADTCDPAHGVSHTPAANGTSCADANVCNGAETCQSATCSPGTPVAVDDNNPCTDDTCDPTAGVAHTPRAAGSSCSDFDLCNGTETCDGAGTCRPGTPVSIDTSNACRAGTCDPATGVVTYNSLPQGTTCFLDVCTAGACNATGECTAAGSVAQTDDNPCTVEWCDPVLGPQQTTCSTLDRTVGTTLNESMKWLYTGTNPVQQGVAGGTIQVEHAVALRGRATTRDGGPLPGVTVTILSHPEFGHTATQTDGSFDMVVNGGGTLIIDYQRAGYLRVQRPIASTWNDYATLPDVVMIPPDPVVTTVDLTGSSGDTQVAAASIQTDDSGTRQGVLLIPSGTHATMHLSDGSTQSLSSMNVRISEYTVGANGQKAMPGSLPGESKYTYAFEVNADEAVAANAASITFDAPLIHYVDNFLQFPAGTKVPLGYYDPSTSAWLPADSGIAVDVVSISGGRAQLDVTGDGIADSASALSAYGITDVEQQKLAELYTSGRMLWRVLIPHFSSWDENWGGGPPGDATGPNGNPPSGNGPCPGGCCSASAPTGPGTGNANGASTIHCDSQVLYEKLPIAGTAYSLNYSSERVPGNIAQNQITIPLSGATVPSSLLRIDLDITVEGVSHHQEFPPVPNQITKFTWDGFDIFGRRPQGAVIANVSVGFVYNYTYTKTDRFGYNGNGLTITANKQEVQAGQFATRCTAPTCATGPAATRATIAVAQGYRLPIGTLDAEKLGLGGWTLNVHHVHEPLPQRLELGTGQRLESTVLPPVLDFMGEIGDGARGSVAMGPDRNAYFAASNRVLRMTPGQGPVLFAGNGNTTYGGDGLPATNPSVGLSAADVAVGRDNSVYIADRVNHIVRRVDPSGIIHTIAGIPGTRSIPAHDGPATSTAMSNPGYLATGPDGTAYVSTDANIMKITTDGQLVRVAGLVMTSLGGDASSAPPDGVATQVRIQPRGLAVSPDGTLYAILTGCSNTTCDTIGTSVVKFVDGMMSRVIGTGCVTCNPTWVDGDIGKLSNVRPTGLVFDNTGTLYFSDINGTGNGGYARVARLTPDGRIFTVAGVHGFSGVLSGFDLLAGQGVPATKANLIDPSGSTRFVTWGPDGLYITNSKSGTFLDLYHLTVPLPHDTGAASIVASRNDDTYFNFDANGRHLSTKHSLTGADLLRFGYDTQGHVVTVTDEANMVTTIERDGSGRPQAVVAPFGQRTTLELDSTGYLARVTDPEGHDTLLAYQDGLLTSLTGARGLTSTMHYGADGRLQLDSDAAGGSQTLSRTESSDGWTVTRSTALSRTTTYAATRLPNEHRSTVETAPDGTTSQTATGPDKVSQFVEADGTAITTSEVPDARFGLNAPVFTRTTTLPSGLASTETSTRSYTNLNATNILNFVDRTDQKVINGRTWRTTYTTSSKTFTTTTPANRTSTRVIDTLGRTAAAQLDGLAATNFFYDTSGRLDHTTQASGALARTTTYGYFPTGASAGYLQSITDALTDPTSYTRDTLGRALTETRASATTAFTWDPESNLSTVTPPGKPSHGMTYTPVNLLETYAPPTAGLPVASTSYTYDADRMLRTETRPDGVQIVRTPDSAGRLSTVQIPGGMLQYNYYPAGTASGAGKTSDILGPYGVNLHFTYDGMLTTSTAWNGHVAGSVAWTYNSDFNKILETVNGASGSAQAAFGYDNDQLLTCASPTTCSPPGSDALQLTRNTAGLVSNITLGSTSETVTYNTFGELARQTATFAPSTPLVDITYDAAGVERDKLGRIVQKTEVIGGTTKAYHYTYDHLRRLTDVTVNGTLEEHFEYDANGNRLVGFNATAGTTYTGTYDDQDRLLSYGPFDFTYTANGELETKTNRVTGEAWLFQYDALGNLLSVGLPNGDVIDYLVDGLGRRVGKKRNGVLEKQWIYRSSLKPAAELDGAGNLLVEFVYGSKNTVPDYVRRGGNIYRIISDQLGSPRLAVNVANLSDVPFTATYTSFGQMTGSALDWLVFGFAGGSYDFESGLVRFGARDYDPQIGRWLSRDPKRFDATGANLFGYTMDDPINHVDPLGEDACSWILGIGCGVGCVLVDALSGGAGIPFNLACLGYCSAADLASCHKPKPTPPAPTCGATPPPPPCDPTVSSCLPLGP
jgi:RHS repeat-associated protein